MDTTTSTPVQTDADKVSSLMADLWSFAYRSDLVGYWLLGAIADAEEGNTSRLAGQLSILPADLAARIADAFDIEVAK